MFPVKIEAVGLVSGLHSTGSDPDPSPQRAMLIAEMRRRKSPDPNHLLATRNFSLVLVRGFLRPGVQKGDVSTWKCGSKTGAKPPACAAATCWKHACRTWPWSMAECWTARSAASPRGRCWSIRRPRKTQQLQLGRGVVLGGGVARESRRSACCSAARKRRT